MTAIPTSGELARRADALMASGDRSGAIQSLKESLRAHPQNFSGWLTLSRWLFEAGHYREAVDVTGAAERFDPLTADFLAVQTHIRARNLAAAETAAGRMMEKVPHHPRAVFTLAHLARARGDSEACVALLEAELVHLPANLTLRSLLLSAREDVGSYAGVLETAREIVQIQESFQSLMALATFSYDLSHIGQYFKGYLRLMEHWDQVLPGRVYRIQYENLVAEPEAQVRALLEHIGVAFEAACLNFHESDRAVRTSSSEQVRQPLNTSGIGQWRLVEGHLKPLMNSLGAETLGLFEDYL